MARILEDYATEHKAFRKAIVAAATYGHLEVVSCFLPQLVGSGRDPDLLREMHNVTWEVLDIAAANGRLNIVTFAVEIAIKWCYLELYTPTSGVDALRLSIAGGHFHMAQFFLELYQIKWNMLAACEEAVIADQFILVEWIFVLYSQYSASEHLLIDLVQNGQAVAVRYLCENFQMCPEIIDTAFRLAKKIEVVRALYETRPIAVGSITVKFRDAARCGIYEEVQCYPGDEEIEIVQLLSKDERIPSHVLRKAFVDAANNCHETLLKLLWDDNRLDSQTRVRAFMKAVSNNHVDVVKSLCAEDHVSSYLEGQALFLA
ncbi:unnamed protein product [Phytophthora lilii]|uniref:Unnamed protein product n=1 Tax=Phytophthora lilii TaxID=2077276 RepID=A0A9W6TWA2_9STRA|nr:unnamed protein product [Phytophthora lilii]